jgi:hypothetical protein
MQQQVAIGEHDVLPDGTPPPFRCAHARCHLQFLKATGPRAVSAHPFPNYHNNIPAGGGM